MKEKSKMSANHLVMNYFAEIGRGSRQDITRFVYDTRCQAEELGSNIEWNILFRGFLQNPKKGITSETVDNEIWYWYSNGFLKKCHKCKKENNCFEIIDDKLREYRTENIPNVLEKVFGSSLSKEDEEKFMEALYGSIKKYRNSVCYQII